MVKKISLKELLTVEDPAKVIETLSFEQGLELLEELVEKVETGALDLDASILSYERGMLVISQLRALLEGAEKKLKVVNKKG